MKKLILLLGLSIPTITFAQQYSIDWYKVSGGGGTSTIGQYSVSGTIGQHDAGGPMTGGNYSLTGGFWALYAVQIPGAPTLYIAKTGPNTALLWWLSHTSLKLSALACFCLGLPAHSRTVRPLQLLPIVPA